MYLNNSIFKLKLLNKYQHINPFYNIPARLFSDTNKNITKHIPLTSLSNKNIQLMQKFENARNNKLTLKSKADLHFQTLWSNFCHIILYTNPTVTNSDTNSIPNDINFLDLSDMSNSVFQDDNKFINFNSNTLNTSQLSKEYHPFSDSNNNNITLINYINPVIVTRIPEEFNLDLETDKNIIITNSTDSKLNGDVKITFSSKSEDICNLFQTKSIRSVNFSLNSLNYCNMLIKSSLECQYFNFQSKLSILKIKKFGLVNKGLIKSNIAEIDIRSYFGPKNKNEELKIEVNYGEILFGACQGNLRIESNDAKIVLDNIECEDVNINTKSSYIEAFINKIGSMNISSVESEIILYLNEDNSSLKVFYENENKYIFEPKKRDERKEGNQADEDSLSIIKISSNKKPVISTISAWDYIKKKIERKIYNKKNENKEYKDTIENKENNTKL